MNIQIDKIYSTKEKTLQGEYAAPFKSFIKFYEDGAVITAAFSNPYEGVNKWFNRENENVSKGTYEISENNIEFTVQNELGKTHYRGMILEDKLVLNFYSEASNNEGVEEYY